jgi:hypothetical protein
MMRLPHGLRGYVVTSLSVAWAGTGAGRSWHGLTATPLYRAHGPARTVLHFK